MRSSAVVRVSSGVTMPISSLARMINQCDLAISLLPAPKHPVVARACLDLGKHMVTTSYVSPEMRALDAEAKAAGLLHRMGGVHDHRVAGARHDRQRPHVGHQRVVAKTDTPFGQKDAVVAGAGDLGGHVRHVPGREELALLDLHDPPGPRRRHQQVRLPAQKRRDLEDVDDFGDGMDEEIIDNQLTELTVADVIKDPDLQAQLSRRALVVKRLKPLPID